MEPEIHEPDYTQTSTGLTDADVRGVMQGSVRLLAALAVVGAGLFCWGSGWQSAVLLLVGATISATSLWEWLRLMTAMNQQMDAGGTPRPMGLIAAGFTLRLGLTVVVLYGSLRYLHGTVLALAAGLGLGVVSLSIKAMALLKRPA